ncbi:hypothetical protein AG1IA_04475 [Rhizoctonia solani AG-1 IA]|uniref:Uncharacterized protein n=1 Tax=Thanatephorus cucumeris (strain AG1-IA) TaxID=983506 RepID=L8WU17_THACA|nr:hypothetical protein AG1IA_04475 [Rhizoctonia solani AG-1 IA]
MDGHAVRSWTSIFPHVLAPKSGAPHRVTTPEFVRCPHVASVPAASLLPRTWVFPNRSLRSIGRPLLATLYYLTMPRPRNHYDPETHPKKPAPAAGRRNRRRPVKKERALPDRNSQDWGEANVSYSGW